MGWGLSNSKSTSGRGETAGSSLVLASELKRWQRRLRLQATLHFAVRIIAAAGLLLAPALYATRAGWLSTPIVELLAWIAVPLAIACALAWCLGARPLREMALLADRVLSTREVITTAWLSDTSLGHPLVDEAHARALDELRASAPAAHIRLIERWPRWLGVLAGLGVMGALFLPLPPVLTHAGASPDRVSTSADEERFEALIEPLAAIEDALSQLDEPEVAAWRDEIQALRESLEAEELEGELELLAKLNEYSEGLEELARKSDERALSDAESLELGAMDAGELQELAERIAEGEAHLLERTLAGMEQAAANAREDQKRWAKRLQREAAALRALADDIEKGGDKALADRLRAIADAAESDDTRMLRALVASTIPSDQPCKGGMCSASSTMREASQALDRLRAMLGEGRPQKLSELMARGGQGARGAGRPGPPSGMPGTRSTNERDEGGRAGEAVVMDREAPERSSRRGEFEALYESELAEAGSYEDRLVTGELLDESQMLGREVLGFGTAGAPTRAAKLPGRLVESEPTRAADLERVPRGYRELVRRYFGKAQKPPSKTTPSKAKDKEKQP